ncbi:MAG: PKD domain-containing protein [Terriglobales bacterium]
MRRVLAALTISFLAVLATAQNLTIAPTTTFAGETGSNTSAPAGFTTQSDGNLGAGNVSKVDTHTLLYPGFNGKIYAHVVGWFGGTNHESIGYNSSDPAVVKAQLNDMVSRGIDGIVHVWYGPGTNISNLETQAIMNEAPNHPGFTFAIMIDQGAIKWGSCYPSCTATQAVINLATYVANTYFPSPSYLRINGRPVLTNFDIDGNYSVDWNAVSAAVPGNPIFLFQNNGGFTHTLTGGSYSWVMPSDSNNGLDYLASFYSTGMKYPTEMTVGATYKGFNDTLASWTMNRILPQQCGQVWLSTFAKINSMYNSTNQLPAVQLVTWDDYEEGTEIETGIDNCVSVAASMSGSVLNWSISGGNESTIDHYTVFLSSDGTNLMPLGDFPVGTSSVDISTFSPAAGTYTLYVKAVGKPSIANKMSNAATLTIAAPAVTSSLSVTPNSGAAPLTVTASANVTTTTSALTMAGTTNSTNIDFGDGTVMTGASATHTYSTPGSYTVKATVTNSAGTTSTSTATVNASAVAPKAALTLSATTGVAPAAITASTAASTDPNTGGAIAGSVVDWGDGTTSAGPSASHAYVNPGTYTVTATVTDTYGASATAFQTVTVTGAGVAITSPATGSTGNSPVHVVATAASGNGVSAMSTYIDDVKVYKTYTASTDVSLAVAPGSHRLVINAWDSNGVLLPQSAGTFTVTAQAPTASMSLSANSAIAPATITATASATDPNVNGTISGYSINWGDGSSSTGASATHTYSTPGTFAVTVTATDNYNQSATATQSVTVTNALAPTVALSLSTTSAAAPATVTATASATDPNAGGSILSYSINWGDGSTSAAASASHTYSTAGTYTVTATATDNYGKSASSSRSLTVTAPAAPTAAMTVSMSGPTATVSTAGSTAGATVINWGDGTSTSATSATHTYNKGGYFTITVTVTNSSGQSASTSQQVTAAGVVIWLPQAGTTSAQPVHIAATAYDSKAIASMIIYLDGNKVWTGYVNNFDVWLNMRSGTHTIVVKAWEDVTGVVYQSSVTFKAAK